MCVTCLGNNLHTHSNHRNGSAPLHNLYNHKNTSINILILNGNHRHVCMYANVNLISHTKLACENVVFSETYCFENKCGVRKAFYLFCKAIGNLVIWKI
jgi:hypothetical protein